MRKQSSEQVLESRLGVIHSNSFSL
jgi:hypothetical protein